MSDFEIKKIDDKLDTCYGMERYKMSKNDILALEQGKLLYTTINCDEYAIVIELEAGEEKSEE